MSYSVSVLVLILVTCEILGLLKFLRKVFLVETTQIKGVFEILGVKRKNQKVTRNDEQIASLDDLDFYLGESSTHIASMIRDRNNSSCRTTFLQESSDSKVSRNI
jgi:hypothetical protein